MKIIESVRVNGNDQDRYFNVKQYLQFAVRIVDRYENWFYSFLQSYIFASCAGPDIELVSVTLAIARHCVHKNLHSPWCLQLFISHLLILGTDT